MKRTGVKLFDQFESLGKRCFCPFPGQGLPDVLIHESVDVETVRHDYCVGGSTVG